jgi:hypothetical protein
MKTFILIVAFLSSLAVAHQPVNANGVTVAGASTNTLVSTQVSVSTPVSTSNSSNVTITEKTSAVPVASATPTNLTASNGTCMGSGSAAAQSVGLGFSFGGTYKDAQCDRRYNSIRLQELGLRQASIALMCQDESVRQAMKDSGTDCPPAMGESKAIPVKRQSSAITVAQMGE